MCLVERLKNVGNHSRCLSCQEGKRVDLIELFETALKDTRANHKAYFQRRVDAGLSDPLAPVLAGGLEITYLLDHDV